MQNVPGGNSSSSQMADKARSFLNVSRPIPIEITEQCEPVPAAIVAMIKGCVLITREAVERWEAISRHLESNLRVVKLPRQVIPVNILNRSPQFSSGTPLFLSRELKPGMFRVASCDPVHSFEDLVPVSLVELEICREEVREWIDQNEKEIGKDSLDSPAVKKAKGKPDKTRPSKTEPRIRDIEGHRCMRRQDALTYYGDELDNSIPGSTEERWRHKNSYWFTNDPDTNEVWVEIEGFKERADIRRKRPKKRDSRK